MNLVLYEIVCSAEELSSKDDNRGGTITYLTVLDLRELDQNFSGRVLNLELLEDGGAIIGDGHVADVVDEHLVEALRSERGLHDVSQTSDGGDYSTQDPKLDQF